MDWWWSRLPGRAPKKTAARTTANDPEVRLIKFKRLYHTALSLCNRPRDLSTEAPLLEELYDCLKRIAALLREESRAPSPHLCLQFAAVDRIYAVIARAASASQNEPVIQASLSILAALVDSEEEDFLSNAIFAKSLMRLATSVLDSGSILVNSETESAILELLFTITAKIRLQPEILRFWFQSTARPELDDVVLQEKQSFVGNTQKNDFPVCYILIERVHYEGRIGDFARTGLLYIFEATGTSVALEEWIVSSDLPTLLASGLGALYSQLSRELSILHPDVTLPAILAMSDYSTTHARATAVSAFADRHKSHMATFLSYLAFWQDLLDHCRSADVKHTLLDHFQILFLQQLLYPSLLQSSDTDAGSSVAVLMYMTAVLESLEYEGLVSMILNYLFAIESKTSSEQLLQDSQTEPPRSPNSARKRQSLMSLTAPKDPDDAVEPSLFSLVDLILNNAASQNPQAVLTALKLASSILTRQKTFAFGTLLKVQEVESGSERANGALDVEVERYTKIAQGLYDCAGLFDDYDDLADDLRVAVESQIAFTRPPLREPNEDTTETVKSFMLSNNDLYLTALRNLLQTFFTNGVDVNLALSQAIISIALCTEIRLDSWLALNPAHYTFDDGPTDSPRPWASYLDEAENMAFSALQQSSRCPIWSTEHQPMLYSTLRTLVEELERVRKSVPNLDYLIAVRKTMLQASGLDSSMLSSEPPSSVNSPTRTTFRDIPNSAQGSSSQVPTRSSSLSARQEGMIGKATPPRSGSLVAASPEAVPTGEKAASPEEQTASLFMPPPPEAPSTTDLLMKMIDFSSSSDEGSRQATLNHVLTNVVVLQEFVLELVAVLQVRAAVLGEKEVKCT